MFNPTNFTKRFQWLYYKRQIWLAVVVLVAYLYAIGYALGKW
jgi:hypothetical protein